MMKRAVTFVLAGLGIAVLAGCPIYSDDHDHRVCLDGDCYDCPDSYYSNDCHAWTCRTQGDCPNGYSCSSDKRCKLGGTTNPPGSGSCSKPTDCSGGNCGADNKCHTGDCSTSGCPSSYVCLLGSGDNGVPACVPVGTDGGGGTTSSCKKDADCPSPVGSKCLTGSCVAPADQCVDQTQCPGDAQCVQGACTQKCSDTKKCSTGYECDLAKGVCTNNPKVCTTSSQCAGGTVCVQEHCVSPCNAGGTCSAGLKCIDGGCTPDQKPLFTCNEDGKQEGCAQGSICLRHSCYIGCSADAGADQCKTQDTFNQCKSVSTSTGQYNVCGSTSNLGNECSPEKACTTPLICVDGYCR